MADYTVIVTNRSPGWIGLLYIPTVIPVTITLSDLPVDVAEIDAIELRFNAITPANISFFRLSAVPASIDQVICGDPSLSPTSGTNYYLLGPGYPRVDSLTYHWYPLPRMAVSPACQLKLVIGGTIGVDYDTVKLAILCRPNTPTREVGYPYRSTYQDAVGAIVP